VGHKLSVAGSSGLPDAAMLLRRRRAAVWQWSVRLHTNETLHNCNQSSLFERGAYAPGHNRTC
jgi:hypothetical protein